MGRSYGVNDISSWKFEEINLPEAWAKHLGDITAGFRMLVEGPPGHGKTEYVMKLAKMLTQYVGKVNANSTEQGKSKTFKQSWDRNAMNEIEPGKYMLQGKHSRTFEPWFKNLQKPNSGRTIILDSIDYMNLTFDQFKQLHERFPQKNLVFVCWNNPMSADSKKIRYACDIKVEVSDFTAHIRSRFGGNQPFLIWPEKVKKPVLQKSLFDA